MTKVLVNSQGKVYTSNNKAIIPSKPKYQLFDSVYDDSNNYIGKVFCFVTENNVEYAVVFVENSETTGKTVNSTRLSASVFPYYKQWEGLSGLRATTLCDIIISAAPSSQAVSYCRGFSYVIDGTTYYGQLPNYYEAIEMGRNNTVINLPYGTTTATMQIFSCTGYARGNQNTQLYALLNYGNTGGILWDGSAMTTVILEIPNV